MFDTLDYLINGTRRQQNAYAVLTKYSVFSILQHFDPILAGTIPLNIDIENSDLDVLCQFTDKDTFVNRITMAFSDANGFSLKNTTLGGHDTIVATFVLEGFPIEIFGQNIPPKEQVAYRHLMAEHKILMKYGEEFRAKVVALKQAGFKTEPAFAQLLGLAGDPYLVLLTYANE
jgi:hypothetical protein